MIIHVSFKTPDAADYATESLSEDEQAEAREALKKWIQYGECVTLEFDTEAGTAKVLEV